MYIILELENGAINTKEVLIVVNPKGFHKNNIVNIQESLENKEHII